MSTSFQQAVQRLGVERVIEPRGALPQGAERLDAGGPLRPYEVEIAVETLNLDSTSFRQLVTAADGDPVGVAEAITAIVGRRGKMHNPITGSGGILIGRVVAAGEDFPDAPAVGERIVTLASLTLTPLRVEHVGPVDPTTPQIPVRGTAYLSVSAPWAPYPEDLPMSTALAALDVCGAAPQTRELTKPGDTVLVLGAGHAGLLALAAARDALGDTGRTVALDASETAVERVREFDFCDVAIQADLRDAVGSLQALTDAGVSRADLTIVVVNATGCEAASILLTEDAGTILFFSMATSFTAAALGSEGMSSTARMLVGSGYFPDRGAYALELVRAHPELRAALEGSHG